MIHDKQIVSLLKLLDDDSPAIRDRVWEKLQANLIAWEPTIRAHLDGLPAPVRKRVQDGLSDQAQRGFRSAWLQWRTLPDEMTKLETAMSALSWHLSKVEKPVTGYLHPELKGLLDGLADAFLASREPRLPSSLARFLFQTLGIRGADADYYNPGNSDLVQVIGLRRGIPISLACLFMLVGHRLGLPIKGCDVPEHFLTRVVESGREIIIDCFDGGKILDGDRLVQLERKYAPDFKRLLHAEMPAEAVVARVLRNLINAFHLAGDKSASDFIWNLADDLRLHREGGLKDD